MARLAVLTLAVLVCLSAVPAASARTRGEAFRQARTCLLRHGATSVVEQRPYGGGWVMFGPRLSSSWAYHPYPGPVRTFTIVFFRPYVSSGRQAQIRACVRDSLTG